MAQNSPQSVEHLSILIFEVFYTSCYLTFENKNRKNTLSEKVVFKDKKQVFSSCLAFRRISPLCHQKGLRKIETIL